MHSMYTPHANTVHMNHQGLSGTPVGAHTTFLSQSQDSSTTGLYMTESLFRFLIFNPALWRLCSTRALDMLLKVGVLHADFFVLRARWSPFIVGCVPSQHSSSQSCAWYVLNVCFKKNRSPRKTLYRSGSPIGCRVLGLFIHDTVTIRKRKSHPATHQMHACTNPIARIHALAVK